MKKVIFLFLCLSTIQLFANINFWSAPQNRLAEPSGVKKIIPLVANKVMLDDVSFRSFQPQIPNEESGSFVLLDMPGYAHARWKFAHF